MRVMEAGSTPIETASCSMKLALSTVLTVPGTVITKVTSVCHAGGGDGDGGGGLGDGGGGLGEGGGGERGGGVGYPPSKPRLYLETGDSLMLVPGKHALLLCMSVITNWKPGLISMKKSDAFVFASAGGARL